MVDRGLLYGGQGIVGGQGSGATTCSVHKTIVESYKASYYGRLIL